MLGQRIALLVLAFGLVVTTSSTAVADPSVALRETLQEGRASLNSDPVAWLWSVVMWIYDSATGLGFTFAQPSVDAPGRFGSQSL